MNIFLNADGQFDALTEGEQKMWANDRGEAPLAKDDREINERYVRGEGRIVIETNREKLPGFVAAMREPGYMDMRPFYQRRPRWSSEKQSLLIDVSSGQSGTSWGDGDVPVRIAVEGEPASFPPGSAAVHPDTAKLSPSVVIRRGGDVMERRHFLKLAFGIAVGATALAASAKAVPLPPIAVGQALVPPRAEAAEPAVVSQDEVDHLRPEPVRWGHHWHRRWHRHWGWHRRHWRHRHW
jgi:hypothetical protein